MRPPGERTSESPNSRKGISERQNPGKDPRAPNSWEGTSEPPSSLSRPRCPVPAVPSRCPVPAVPFHSSPSHRGPLVADPRLGGFPKRPFPLPNSIFSQPRRCCSSLAHPGSACGQQRCSGSCSPPSRPGIVGWGKLRESGKRTFPKTSRRREFCWAGTARPRSCSSQMLRQSFGKGTPGPGKGTPVPG